MKKIIIILTILIVGCSANQAGDKNSSNLRSQDSETVNPNPITNEQYTDITNKMDKAIESKNPANCEKLENENMKNTCLITVYAQIAYDQKDPNVCDELENKSSAQFCRDQVEAALN